MNIIEYLYLSKKKDIKVLINTGKIAQHHIDGIRFMYMQYTIGKPGIILNDLRSCNRILQIVLFLESLQSVLEKPALILSNKVDVSEWITNFKQRVGLRDVVAVEDPNPWGKHTVYIYDMENVSKLSRRDWSLVVVDDDAVSKQMLRTVFKANFKIWITSLDVKNNLEVFSTLYKWIYSNDKHELQDLTMSKNDALNVIDQEILMSAFLEDIVLRRNDITKSVSEVPWETSELGDKNVNHNVSKKNKDVTGTKIKRTKRKLENVLLPNSENNKVSRHKRKNVFDTDSEDLIIDEMCVTDVVKKNKTVIDRGSDTNNCKTKSNLFLKNKTETINNIDCLKTLMRCEEINENQDDNSCDNFDNNCDKIIGHDITNVQIDTPSSDMSHEKKICKIEEGNYGGSCENNRKAINNALVNIDFQDMSQDPIDFKDAIRDIVNNENILESNTIDKTDMNEYNETQNTLNASQRISNMDTKLNELDEKVLKKFKGTLLDSIF